MNERIKELELQCWSDESPEWAENVQMVFNVEKFAELIVRECARAVDKVYEDAEPDHGCYDWATWAYGSDVLKHFGVEE